MDSCGSIYNTILIPDTPSSILDSSFVRKFLHNLLILSHIEKRRICCECVSQYQRFKKIYP